MGASRGQGLSPFEDPRDPAYRPPLEPGLPFPPKGEVDHPNLKELLYTNLGPSHVVVDVGCGPGPFEYHRYAARFLAFDMFEPESSEGLKPGVDAFRLGKLETFPFEDASCDAVVMGFILEHVPNPGDFLREAERVLRPGGWVYIALPIAASMEDRLFRLATTVAGSKRGPHIQYFSLDSFRGLVRERTRLEFTAWHRLGASYLWMDHPKLRWLRKPFLQGLRLVRPIGIDGFSSANLQALLRKLV